MLNELALIRNGIAELDGTSLKPIHKQLHEPGKKIFCGWFYQLTAQPMLWKLQNLIICREIEIKNIGARVTAIKINSRQ